VRFLLFILLVIAWAAAAYWAAKYERSVPVISQIPTYGWAVAFLSSVLNIFVRLRMTRIFWATGIASAAALVWVAVQALRH
jgi:hypothetical protein